MTLQSSKRLAALTEEVIHDQVEGYAKTEQNRSADFELTFRSESSSLFFSVYVDL